MERYRDIAKKAKDGTRIVILACENQNKVHYGMVIRNMLYDSLDYTEQMNEKRKSYRERQDWGDDDEFLSGLKKGDLLNPVVTIVFYWGEKECGWDGQTTLHGLTGLEREEYKLLKKYVPDYHINVINVKDLKDFSCPNRDLQMIFGMLEYRKDKKQLKEYIEKNADYFADMDEESYDAAVVMLGKEQELKRQKRKKEEKRDMCKALDDLYHDGVMEGKTVGRAEGRAECIVELLLEKGDVPQIMRDKIYEQKDPNILRDWFKIAVEAENVEEFEKKIGASAA